MKRVVFFLFLSGLFSLYISGVFAHAPADNLPAADVERLKFEPMAHSADLAIAEGDGYAWIQGSIPAGLIGVPVVFQIPTARIYDYDLYLHQNGQLTRALRNIDRQSRHFKSRFPQYELIPSDTVYYLRINDHTPQQVEIQLEERTQFSVAESFSLLRIGLYYGLALMSLIFNFVFYLTFKDKRFITYCLLLLTIFVSFFYEDGMFYYFSEGRWTMDYLIILNSALSSIVALPFTFYFLDLHTLFRRIRKWFFLAAALLLTGVFVYALTDSLAVGIFVYTLCFLLPASGLYLAAKRFKKDVYARFLVISFGLVVVTGLLYMLYTRVDSSVFSWFGIHTFRLVSALEIIAISFAIVFKIRALQHQNDRYREELDNYLKTLEVRAADEQYRKNSRVGGKTPARAKNEVVAELKIQYDLTDREIDVLLCIWEGLTNKEIAERLFITVSTAKYHVSNLYLKLDVKNRNQVQVLRKALWNPSADTSPSP